MFPTAVDDGTLEAMWPISVRYAVRMGVNPRDAEDIAQEAVLRLASLPEAPRNPAAWITCVTTRLVFDQRRGQGRRPDLGDLDELAERRRELLHFAERELSASYLAITPLTFEQISAILVTVVSQREVEVLKMVAEGSSYSEIADVLGYASADIVKATVYKVHKKATEVATELMELRHHPRVY
jgi:DNA-directed RNA polymerase specialized sigma24 family protein